MDCKQSSPTNQGDAKKDDHVIAFCCAQCSCTDEDKAKILQATLENLDEAEEFCVNEKEFLKLHMVHRRCCHKFSSSADFLPDLVKAQCSAISAKKKRKRVGYKENLQRKHKVAKIQETTFYNEESLEDPESRLCTSQSYMMNRKEFYQTKHRDGMVVLDTFSGYGTAVIVLKRLGIHITKIAHVEHDPIAHFVFQANHDAAFANGLRQHDAALVRDGLFPEGCASFEKVVVDDHIQHIYYSAFEDIENDIDTFVKNIGEVDFVVGGPPCVDYSGLNAYRQGTSGKQGSYMLRVAQLIERLQEKQKDRKIFFLIENTIIRNDQNVDLTEGDLQKITEAFKLDWDPYLFDAAIVSPCRRHRCFFSNIPYQSPDDDRLASYALIRPESCLDDGFQSPSSFIEPNTIAKIPTLLASVTGIDDDRMLVYRRAARGGGYECRHITVRERERMMGLPEGYIEFPVEYLFDRLLYHGYGVGTDLCPHEGAKHWQELLPPSLHHFAGDFLQANRGRPYKFEPQANIEPYVQLKLANPASAQQLSHFSKEEYGKHLIGNAFSVPVVEALLRPLQKIFQNSPDRYDGYQYPFKWQVTNGA